MYYLHLSCHSGLDSESIKFFNIVLFLSLYLRGKEKEKERKRKRKHAIVFYVFALLSRSSLFGYAKSIFVRYCAMHTLTYCRALFEQSEFARLKKLDVVQNKKLSRT